MIVSLFESFFKTEMPKMNWVQRLSCEYLLVSYSYNIKLNIVGVQIVGWTK